MCAIKTYASDQRFNTLELQITSRQKWPTIALCGVAVDGPRETLFVDAVTVCNYLFSAVSCGLSMFVAHKMLQCVKAVTIGVFWLLTPPM